MALCTARTGSLCAMPRQALSRSHLTKRSQPCFLPKSYAHLVAGTWCGVDPVEAAADVNPRRERHRQAVSHLQFQHRQAVSPPATRAYFVSSRNRSSWQRDAPGATARCLAETEPHLNAGTEQVTRLGLG